MGDEIIVSINCITYNHAPYIRQCLEGFMMQKTDFSFEILINDDASIDGTQDIIREYELMYPNIIKPIYQKENQYSQGKKPSFVFNFPRARGKYIAMCEGDDYWIDPLKLQKQVDFLEANLDCGLVHTHAHVFINDKKIFDRRILGLPQNSLDDLLVRNGIVTLTTCFRKDILEKYILENKRQWKIGDYPMWIYFAKKTNIGFINDITGIYRVLPNSASHSTSLKKEFNFYMAAFDLSCYYAKLYGCNYLLTKIATQTSRKILYLYTKHNEFHWKNLYIFLLKYRVIDIKLFILLIILKTPIGKKYLRKRWGTDL